MLITFVSAIRLLRALGALAHEAVVTEDGLTL